MKRRFASLLLALTMAAGFVVPAGAVEYPKTFRGDVLLAVNTCMETQSRVPGNFTVDNGGQSLLSLEAEVYDRYTDRESGEDMMVLAPVLEMPEPVAAPAEAVLESVQPTAAEYQVGSRFDLTTQYYRAGVSAEEAMVCIYAGTYCTVWTSTSDPEAIRLSEKQGAAIGAYFDQRYPTMVAAFGQPHDADGDGKVAIMCYDLSDQFDMGEDPTSYTAGYFYGVDMIDSAGKVNGVNYGASNHINGLDCIHIDTFPTMGRIADPLGNLENSYSTLFHEFQHMINYSHQVKNGWDGYVEAMETYLNEAFSMAAEHLICGAESTKMRVDFFNSNYYSTPYTTGTALTCWSGNLSGYSNSFLFGQYIRTRYGQMQGNDGASLYKMVLDSRRVENEEATLGIIVDLLETTEEQLLLDFWAAVYCKAPSGVYGFNGEAWADALDPVVEADFSDTGHIYNGGVKFYYPGPEGCTVTASKDVALMSLSVSSGSQVKMVCRELAGENTLRLEAWGTGARTAAVILYSSDGRMMGLEWLELSQERLSHLVDTRGLRMQMLMLGEGVNPLCGSLSHK